MRNCNWYSLPCFEMLASYGNEYKDAEHEHDGERA